MKNINISCAILAGGKNTRFNGVDKAFMQIKGKPLIENLLQVLNPIFNDILIISNQKEKYNKFQNIKTFSDILENIGPLGGIYTALKNCKTQYCFVMACDMPNISQKSIEYFIDKLEKDKTEILVPIFNKLKEPLFAIYSVGVLKKLEDFIINRNLRKAMLFLDERNVSYINIPEKYLTAFKNINSPKDLK